jgi:hypothetical protein
MTITQDLLVRSLRFGKGLIIISSSLTLQISSHLLLFYSLNYQYLLEYVMQIKGKGEGEGSWLNYLGSTDYIT